MITFKIEEVLKKPVYVAYGDMFSIDRYLATCTCLEVMDEGLYLITGKLNSEMEIMVAGTAEVKKQNKVVLSG